MKLFDKKAEKKVWIILLGSIPYILFLLWIRNGEIGLKELLITLLTLVAGIGIIYFLKWHINKK